MPCLTSHPARTRAPIHVLATQRAARLLHGLLLFAGLMLALLAAAPARAAGATAPTAALSNSSTPSATAPAAPSGLWVTSSGDYLVLLQNGSDGTTVGLQVAGSFDALRVWLGSGSPTAVDLRDVLQDANRLQAGISGSSLAGSITLGSAAAQPLNASLALAWVPTEYAGIWQKAGTPNAYLAFFVVNSGNTKLAIQIDVTINANASYAYEVYTGTLNGSSFTGLSLTGAGTTSRLTFNSAEALSGSLTTAGRPPQTSSFTASRLIAAGP